MNKLLSIFLTLSFIFIFQTTIFKVNNTKTGIIFNTKKQENINEKNYKNPFHENMWGVFMQKKAPAQSFKIFADLTKTNKYAYKWLINFLYKTGNNQKLSSITPLIKSSFPQLLSTDPDAGFMVAYALSCINFPANLPAGNMAENACPITYNQQAIDILLPLNQKFPTHQQVASLLSTLYDLNNDPRNALEISEKYLNSASSKPTDFLEYFKNASRYLKLEDKENALKSTKKCIELQPAFPNGYILLATIYDQMDNIQEAIDACKNALEVTGQNNAIEYMIIRLFFKSKKAQNKANDFFINKKCFEKAIELIRKKEYEKAFDIMDKCLISGSVSFENLENLSVLPKNNPEEKNLLQKNLEQKPEKPGNNQPEKKQDQQEMIKIKLIKNDSQNDANSNSNSNSNSNYNIDTCKNATNNSCHDATGKTLCINTCKNTTNNSCHDATCKTLCSTGINSESKKEANLSKKSRICKR